MKRYIFPVLMALVGMVCHTDGFNPNNPPEPTPAYRVTLAANPPEAATLSGAGSYFTNTRVTVKAVPAGEEWELIDWTDGDGTVVSRNASFTYTVKNFDVTLTANFRRVPLSTVTIKSNPESMFKATGTIYKVGQSVDVSCNNYSYYTFQNWTDQTGAVISTSRSFTYTVPDGNPVLTANYTFTPGSPAEPTETKPKHKVYFTANPAGAGSFSQSSGMQVSEGSSFSITASARESYAFVNWTDATGSEVGTSETFRSTMGTEDVTLVANFRFSPGSPSDPGQSNKERYTLYLPTVQMYQGETTMLPVYLENTGNVAELRFAIRLPDHVTALTDGLMTTSRTSAYTPVASQSGNTLTVSVVGGSLISGDNGVLLYIPLTTETGCVDGEYPVTFASASAVLADGMAKTVTTRAGMLEIVTLEEGELQAQFGVDRYLNRVQFTNMSSATARTFVWDFGDGTTSTEESPMHIYDTPGTYTVRLTAKAIVKTSTAEQVIVVNAPGTWTASGDYTLNPGIEGIRNFTSIAEMVEIISQCRIDGNITADYQGSRMTHSIYDDTELDRIGTIAAALKAGDYMMTMKSTDMVRSINIGVKADEDYYRTVMGWLECMPTVDVNIFLNYVGINTSALRAAREQTVYSGETTEAVALTAMTTGGTDVSWASVVGAYCPINGRLYDGTGDIPAMTLTLEGKTAASLDYDIVYTLDGLVLYTMTYRFNVLPAIEYVDAGDLAALRMLYNTLGGDQWTKKWDITSDVIEQGNWQGVTFDDDGHVTAIALSNNRLTGTVPSADFILPRLRSLNLSKNNISGDLAAFTSRLVALETLNVSYCLFESLDAPLPRTITSLNLGYQLNNRALSSFDMQEWAMSDAIDNVALTSIMSYDHAAQSWTAHPRLRVYSSGAVVAYLDYFESTGAYGITLSGIYNIASSTECEVQAASGIAEGCRLRATLSWQRGDANADGGVDVADAQQTLNYILARHKGNFNYAAANTYADDIVNIQDIVSTVNIFIDGTPSASASRVKGTVDSAPEATIYASDDAIVLASDKVLGAIDFTIGDVSASQVAPALNRNIYQTIIKDTACGVRVVIISPVGSALPSANSPVLNVYGDCTLLRASAADIDADAVSVGVPTPDGIESINADKAAEKAYDLLGRPATSDRKGILITKGKKNLNK